MYWQIVQDNPSFADELNALSSARTHQLVAFCWSYGTDLQELKTDYFIVSGIRQYWRS